ncbi:antirestriction protein ArdA [Gordonia malaquae]|uniref:antirestriction protein ArdA n=1 Tax=Gordonia malaquae TaxID=410332 RepID=UPI0030C79E79
MGMKPSVAITEPDRPRVWIGSLAAYNGSHDGVPRLIGEWYDATDAGSVTVADLHKGTGVPFTDDDELWVMDLDGDWPVRTEMDLSTAAEWGSLYEEVTPTPWPAFCALARAESVDDPRDVDVQRFIDRYRGEWESFEDYVSDYIENVGEQNSWPEEARQYFDLARYARDLEHGYTVENSPSGVYVFDGC